jgi:ribosomal protein S18 acetylase RimI-like enzyme
MGDISYEINGKLTAQEVCDLTVSVGWNNPGQAGMDLLQRVWDETVGKVTARDEAGTLVGMCRAYWDGGFTATIVSVIVHPALQGQGIGRQMITLLMEQLEALGVYRVTLNAAKGKERFYEQFGFRTRETVTPMIMHTDRREERECPCCSRS